MPIVPAFYVSTTGDDNNAGTLEAPFATLKKAQTAMRASATIKTTYIRAGNYTLPTIANCDGSESCGLSLSSADSGETWSYYPPDGVDSADFTGNATSASTGLFHAILVADATNLTINGLSIHNFAYAGIASGGGTKNLTVENNVLFNGYYVPGSASNPGGFTCYGCASATISHNVIHDIAAWGITLGNVNGDISNLLVTGNVIYDTCTNLADCSAIYVQDTSATATNLRFSNNFVRDGNTFATLGSGYGAALYADDCTSNLTASGNVLTGRNGSNTVLVHGGNDVHLLGNLTDLTSYKQSIAAFQTSSGPGCSSGKMSGNEYENNVVIGGGGGGGYQLLSGSPMNAPTIANNAYHNYGGAAVSSGGDYGDANPVSEDPEISGWTYDIAAASPVFDSPVKFPALVGGWGPPGYVIPETGTPPASPH